MCAKKGENCNGGRVHPCAGTGSNGETFFSLPDPCSYPAGIIQRVKGKKKKKKKQKWMRDSGPISNILKRTGGRHIHSERK